MMIDVDMHMKPMKQSTTTFTCSTGMGSDLAEKEALGNPLAQLIVGGGLEAQEGEGWGAQEEEGWGAWEVEGSQVEEGWGAATDSRARRVGEEVLQGMKQATILEVQHNC